MATIEAIEKELDLKVKSLKKLVVLIDGQEKLVKGLEKQEKALKPDAEKSKDKKVKDNYKQAQKEVVDAEKRLDDLTTSQQSATEVIAKLNSRLRWITEFVEARKGFVPWWDKEEAKMATLVDKTRDLAQDAEEASKSAQAAVSSGDFAGAREAGQDAGKAAREAAAKAEAAEKLYDGWGGTWTEQRNLKSSHMPKEDPASYADLTKKAYDVFKVGQNLMTAARRWGGEAARSAETAGQIAESGGDLLAMYGTILKSALQNLEAIC